MFEVEWRGRRVALKASNGRYVSMKKNGQLAAISDFVGEPESRRGCPRGWGPGLVSRGSPPAGHDELFALKLINRPLLVLRGPHGFVRQRPGSAQLDTNGSAYDVFQLSFSDGAYHIRGGRGHTGGGGGQWPGQGGWGVASRSQLTLPWAQAAAAVSGTRAATAACAATGTARRTSCWSSGPVDAWPSAPPAASTCGAAPPGCFELTATRPRASHSGNSEPHPNKPSLERGALSTHSRAPGGREAPH